MALRQGGRPLLQLCMRNCQTYSKLCNVWGASSLTQQQGATAATAAASSSDSSTAHVRWYAADAQDPMILPLQRQSSLQQQSPAGPPDKNRGPWERVTDEATGGVYWWNKATGVTTPVGAPKPDAWVEVVDKQTGLAYYWNKESNDTTAVGEPMPGPDGRVAASQPGYAQQQQVERPSAASVLGNSLAVGFGIGLVFGIIRLFI